MKDLVSIIVPIFRVEKYLEKCINSLLSQTYQNIEIILVNDGSDDGCPKICDKYAKIDNRIQVVHKQNGGLSDARNAGIEIAKGRYYAFVDSDDMVSPNFIEYLYKALTENNADISQCEFISFNKTNPAFDEIYIFPKLYDSKQMLKNLSVGQINVCSTVTWSKLYKSELFSDIRFPFGKLHEDEFTTYKLFDKAKTIAHLELSLYGYFENSQGIIHSKIKSKRLDGIEALLERYAYYKSVDYSDLLKVTANQIFENFLNFSNNKLSIEDPKAFKNRCQNLYKNFKNSVPLSNLRRIYSFICKLSNSYTQLYFWYTIYLFLGKISKTLKLSKIKCFFSKLKKNISLYKELNQLLKDYIPDKTIFIIGSIEYDNLGDHAIIFAQKNFLENLFQNYNILELRDSLYLNLRTKIKKRIKPSSILTIPGGGNMGNIWFDDELRRRYIIEDFPNNKIIVFPQTIDYTDDESGKKELEISKEIYSKHKNLILCARENVSFEKMKSYYPFCKVILVPDIVLSIPVSKDASKRNGVLLCFREDKEKSLDPLMSKKIYNVVSEHYKQIHYVSTISPNNISYKKREEYLNVIWDKFSKAELVITDRLHGMIFSVITKTPCLVFDNKNHKISETYTAWLKDCNYILPSSPKTFIEDIKKVAQIQTIEQPDFLLEKFENLKRLLNE